MPADPSGVPGFDRAQRRGRQWRLAFVVVVIVALVGVVVLIDVIRDQSATLANRTPTIAYIEQQGEQQACVDKVFAEALTALSNVVLAAVLPESVPEVPPPPQPEDFADDLRNVLIKLDHLDPTLPVADQLCPLPLPPEPLVPR